MSRATCLQNVGKSDTSTGPPQISYQRPLAVVGVVAAAVSAMAVEMVCMSSHH